MLNINGEDEMDFVSGYYQVSPWFWENSNNKKGKENKMLCEKCVVVVKEAFPYTARLHPWIHCHHEEEKLREKCWCEEAILITLSYQTDVKTTNGSIKYFNKSLTYCPSCKRRVEVK